jgi:ribosomal protein S18 acetylase RimI-like enzyme
MPGRHSFAAERIVQSVHDRTFASVPQGQRDLTYRTLVSAFMDDPVERWLYPELSDYQVHFPRLLVAFGGQAFDEQTVWRLGEWSAVALWLPPGAQPDGDAIVAVLTETVSPDKHDDTFAVVGQMDAAHPTFPHWYLPWFGVDPVLQGRGWGGELMEHCLEIVDVSHVPAYLETPNPRNLTFYERHGFEVTGTAQAGRCPPVTFMLRAAR